MADLRPGAQKLLPWWNEIQSAVNAELSTHDLWSALANAFVDSGFEFKGVDAIDLQQLRSIAVRQREATKALTNASLEAPLTYNMIARNVVTRNELAMQTNPAYVIRFEQQLTRGGEDFTEWRSLPFEGYLPQSKGDLIDQIQRDAERLANDYEGQHVGFGTFSILEV